MTNFAFFILCHLLFISRGVQPASLPNYPKSEPNYLKSEHKIIVERWLLEKKKYVLATDKDCDCEDYIQMIRKGIEPYENFHIPNYHPYYFIGDFNDDGKIDFSVAVKIGMKGKNLNILVFNGPFEKKRKAKAPYVLSGYLKVGASLFYFPDRKPTRLVFGRFETEGCWLEPIGTSYTVKCDDEI